MHTFRILLTAGLLAVSLPATTHAQAADSTFARAQRLVSAGEGAAGRALVDSALAAAQPGSLAYAEALYWRASLASSAADAERDYLRVSVEYPLSPSAEESLLRLAQLEMARGDRDGARRHLQRLLREHPGGPSSARAGTWAMRLAFDDGDVAAGCAALDAARGSVTANDVELRNQLDYYAPRCSADATEPRAPTSPGLVTRPVEAEATAPPPRNPAPSRATTSQFTVQVAAYNSRTQADAAASRLAARGFSVRVTGTRAPYRVRVGRYATRAEATAAAARMKRAGVNGMVVTAEPR